MKVKKAVATLLKFLDFLRAKSKKVYFAYKIFSKEDNPKYCPKIIWKLMLYSHITIINLQSSFEIRKGIRNWIKIKPISIILKKCYHGKFYSFSWDWFNQFYELNEKKETKSKTWDWTPNIQSLKSLI